VVYFEIDAPPVRTKDALELAADRARTSDAGEVVRTLSGKQHSVFTGRLNPRTKVQEGQTVKLAVDVERLYFFDPETGSIIR
jgi:hypothetical protein